MDLATSLGVGRIRSVLAGLQHSAVFTNHVVAAIARQGAEFLVHQGKVLVTASVGQSKGDSRFLEEILKGRINL
ncbi:MULTISPECIES: hypothetical protein [unclassified Rhizobium]|uniref:hypothetical protein n=1 Tax=unclassified Rhizobium TaxID=2613769 RepID=UPI00288B7439|nr:MULTISPECIES: hypothetical protein [unclassified Rhizobium]